MDNDRMSKDRVKEMRGILESALADTARKMGVQIDIGNASFGPTSAKYALTVSLIDKESGQAWTPEATDYRDFAELNGLNPAWLWEIFRDSTGREMRVIGLRQRSTKHPVLVLDMKNNREYACPVSTVVKGFARMAEKEVRS